MAACYLILLTSQPWNGSEGESQVDQLPDEVEQAPECGRQGIGLGCP